MTFYTLFTVLDWTIFIIVAFSVFYFFFFVIASKFYHNRTYSESGICNKILVLFPAYKEDAVVVSSVKKFLLQDYPKDRYEVVVISDHMQDATNEKLRQLSATVLTVTFEQSSKAKALNFAMDHFNVSSFDLVTILDADNEVDAVYLRRINNACASGVKAVQAHRVAKNTQTDVAVFDAVSEEVNNAIFRKGHRALGLSSALIGSGMSFDFNWFKENVVHLYTAGEDKELEALLLKQSIFIDYINDLYVMDEKTSQQKVYSSQRQRWLAAQYSMLFSKLKDIPVCIRTRNVNYLDKIIQWMLLPRVVMFGLTGVFAIFFLVVAWESAIKWFVLVLLMCLVFALATPWDLLKVFIRKSWKTVPVLFFTMAMNFFKIKKGKAFIHTPHGEE